MLSFGVDEKNDEDRVGSSAHASPIWNDSDRRLPGIRGSDIVGKRLEPSYKPALKDGWD